MTNTEFEEYTVTVNAPVKQILARYNGYGDAAQEYGEDCFEFFSLFREANEVIANED